MRRGFDREDEGGLVPAFGPVSRSERRQADLFLADLLGERPPARSRRALPQRVRPLLPPPLPRPPRPARGSAAPAALFDRFVHGRVDRDLGLVEGIEGEWEAVAFPASPTSPASLQQGDVVVQRALAQGRLGFARVLGEEIDVAALYGEDGCIRDDTLVLRRRGEPEALPGAPAEEIAPLGEQVPPRTPAASRFRSNADLERILNNQRELRVATPPMRGADVTAVQQALVDLGYTLPRFGVDGIYRNETAAAVRKFQTEQRTLNPAFLIDGIVGDQTLGRLDEIFAVLDRPCGAPTVAPADPSTPPIAEAGRITYDVGSRPILGLGVSLDVRGTIFYPAQAAGNGTPFSSRITGAAPIVVLAHGNHAMFHNPADRTDEDEVQHAGWLPIRNHDGYVYLQERLARLGIISVSVDCNQTNGAINLTATNIRRRSGLIVESIRHVLSLAAAGSGSVLDGRVDFARTGLFGHSRGGEAVLVVPGDLAAQVAAGGAGAVFAPVQVRGVMSLAPTDAPTLAAMPAGFPYAVILPAADGDVVTNDGAGFYDRFAPAPFKTQIYAHGMNHNRFNREWVNDDFVPADSQFLHELLLTVYASAFFRHTLTGVDFSDILLGRTRVTGIPDEVHISAERDTAQTVDDHEDLPVPPATRTTTNTLGGATALLPNASAVEIAFSQPGVAPNDHFFGATRGMVVDTTETYASYRSALPAAMDLTARDIWIRACEIFTGSPIPPQPTRFQIGLEDTAGEICFVPSGLLPRPFDRSDPFTKNMLKTFRFGPSCFALARPGVARTQIRAIHIRMTGPAGRRIGFDQLQLL